MSFRVEKNVMVAMRDGVELATDLWIPAADGPHPALVVRLPYGKDVFPGEFTYPTMPSIFAFVEAGYAVVWQDCRGTFGSAGVFDPMAQEPDDGVDTIAWVRAQPWCDGNIGAYGHSYLGFVQWASAAEGPEGLKAIAPCITTTDYYLSPWYSAGGALSWHATWSWTALMTVLAAQASGPGAEEELADAAAVLVDGEAHLARLPVGDQPLFAEKWPWWGELLGHPARDGYWQGLSTYDRADRVSVPALNIGGWFDLFIDSTVLTFTRMRREAGSGVARSGQRLVIGPWDHNLFTGVYHDRQFGLHGDIAMVDITAVHLQFFDRHVRGADSDAADAAPVRIFVMGVDEWRDEQDWPLPDTRYTDYFLRSSGGAATADGDGVLDTRPPVEERADSFRYDPADPVPTAGGRVMMPASLNAAGPVDQRAVETRPDVLCFTTDVLDRPVEVTGHVSLVLHVSSSAVDTDFTGKLVDVFPDGRAIYLTDGVLRARYRRSPAAAELLEPGAVNEVTLDLSVTSNVFLPGHRIRLEVSSSNFPRYDRNLNTGGVLAEDGTVVVATNIVFHGPEHPSRLVLPVIDR